MIFQRVSPEEMYKHYKLPPQDTPNFQQFLAQLAMVSGRLLKAGIADVDNAARSIIQDWNSNKLPFTSDPPKFHESSLPGPLNGEADIGESMVVSGGLAPAFDLDGLLDNDGDSHAVGDDRCVVFIQGCTSLAEALQNIFRCG